MNTNTNTNPIFAALSTAFVAELDAAYLVYFGDEYADSYFSDAVDEATRYAGNLEADFLPFLCDAADAYGEHFNEWVAARVPAHTAELAELWVELGFPEPESDCGGDITSRMLTAVYEAVAEQARDAADKLAELVAGFTERFNADELFSRADELAEALAEDEEEAEFTMLDRGARPCLDSSWHWNDGERVRRFSTARAALAYSNALRGE